MAVENEENANMAGPKKGLADAMSKILRKKVPQNRNAILSKGKTDQQIIKGKEPKETSDEKGEEITEEPQEKKIKLSKESGQDLSGAMKKKLWEEIGRVIPTPEDREKEKALQKIATRGVVHLFNTVKEQQKVLEKRLQEAGSSERKREKVIQSMTKGKFLDSLNSSVVKSSGTSKSAEQGPSDIKEEKEEDKPSWSVLRDDFMMGATIKDWDKQSDSDASDTGT